MTRWLKIIDVSMQFMVQIHTGTLWNKRVSLRNHKNNCCLSHKLSASLSNWMLFSLLIDKLWINKRFCINVQEAVVIPPMPHSSATTYSHRNSSCLSRRSKGVTRQPVHVWRTKPTGRSDTNETMIGKFPDVTTIPSYSGGKVDGQRAGDKLPR